MVTRATANNSQAESLMLSKALNAASGAVAAVAPAQLSEATQQPRIATPALLVRPCKAISTISARKANAHPEYTVSLTKKSRGKSLSRSLIPEDHSDSLQQYQNIQKEASVFDVVKIIGQLVAGIFCRGAIGEVDLRPTGDARSDPVALGIIGD